jgi:GT2 family glycosyltransferase
MNRKLVSIIIVNWNARQFMQQCAYSIKQNTDYPAYEVIVIDNGSKDGSIELLLQLRKKGLVDKVIFNKKNEGFAFANNQGFKAAKGSYLFMLNNDVLLTKGWLSNAVKALESDERIAAVGSTLIGFGDSIEKAKKNVKPREKQALCGAAMLLKRSVVQKLGLLDAAHFSPAYGEETDWCYRARNSGFRLVEAGDSVIKHFGSGSTLKQLPGKKQYLLMNTHRLRAMLYNLSFRDFLNHVPGLGLIFIQSFRQGMALTLLHSYWNNLVQLPSILAERKKRKQKAIALRKQLNFA